MKKICQYLSSIKLTIYLGLAICALLFIGSLYFIFYGGELATLNEKLFFQWLIEAGFKGLLYDWWLWLLVIGAALFGLNTFVCSVDHLTALLPKLFRPKLDSVSPQWISDLGVSRKIAVNQSKDEAAKILRRAINYCGFKKIYSQKINEDIIFFTHKGRGAAIAPYLTHLGFIIVLIGHLISSGLGFKSFGNKLELGEKAPVPGASYWVNLNSFKLCVEKTKEEKGKIRELLAYERKNLSKADQLKARRGRRTQNRFFKEYCATVYLGKGDNFLTSGIMSQNNPFVVEDMIFYLADWGNIVKNIYLKVTTEEEATVNKKLDLIRKTEEIVLPIGREKKINKDITIVPQMVYADFAIDESGAEVNLSPELLNPALMILIFDKGALARQEWLVLNEFDLRYISYNGIGVELSGVSTHTTVWYNIVKNPGATVVLAGGIIFILSMCWLLLIDYRRIWFYVKSDGEETSIICGGISRHNAEKLKAKINLICDNTEKYSKKYPAKQ